MLLQQLLFFELNRGVCQQASSLQDSAPSDILEAISWHEVIKGKAILQWKAQGCSLITAFSLLKCCARSRTPPCWRQLCFLGQIRSLRSAHFLVANAISWSSRRHLFRMALAMGQCGPPVMWRPSLTVHLAEFGDGSWSGWVLICK